MRIFPHGPMTWKVMQGSAWKDIANWDMTTQQLHTVATPCFDDHQFERRRNWICRSIVKSLLTDGSDMSQFGAHW